MISIAMTFKGRENFLNYKLLQILVSNFNKKEVEICITVPEYTDDLLKVIMLHYKKFHQIKLAISDRNKLPFKITTNQPTCDMNTQICNQVTFEKVIRTDPEVLFTDPNQLQYINDVLDNKEICLWHDTLYCDSDFPKKYFGNDLSNLRRCGGASNTCFCFNKSEFIRLGGFEEKFALGVAAEDSYFINNTYGRRGKAVLSKYDVIHRDHGPSWNANPIWDKLYNEYTKPLYAELSRLNQDSNIDNPDWQRPEMLSNQLTFKDS